MECPHSDTVTSIMHLPDDCLCFIFQRLKNGYDRDSFGLTCHRWLNIQNLSRRSLQFHYALTQQALSLRPCSSLNVNSFHIYKLLNRFQHLHHLYLSGCTEIIDSSLFCLQHHGSELQSIYLDCCYGITNNGFSIVWSSCPSLTRISLYRCNITDFGLQTLANTCLSLVSVNLSYCTQISDSGLNAISQNCCCLQAMKVSYCRSITGIGFKGCSPTLSYVDVESCKVDSDGVWGIVSGGGLEFLNASCMSWSIYGGDLAGIGEGFATRLKILNIRMCRNVSDESIIAIANGCPLLQEWNLALCHGVTVLGWELIGSHCNNLEKLHVNRCRNLCDRGLQALRAGCRRLMILYMNQNSRVSNLAVELFKLHRFHVEIKEEEMMCIGPDWITRR